MGGEIAFYTSIAEQSLDSVLGEVDKAFHEIAGGIFCFPDVEYVEDWKAWFKYMLPTGLLNILAENIIVALMNTYPRQIVEEYPSFRDDIVYALGTTFWSRRWPPVDGEDAPDPVFNDIWNYSYEVWGDAAYELLYPMLFCIKYLYPFEIKTWVKSLTEINSLQWRLHFVLWLWSLEKFLYLAQNWPSDGIIREILKESGLSQAYWIPHYASLNEFIPAENLTVFKAKIVEQIDFDTFQSWGKAIIVHFPQIEVGARERISAIFDVVAQWLYEDVITSHSQLFYPVSRK